MPLVTQWLKTGFGLVIGFMNNLRVVTTIIYNIIAAILSLHGFITQELLKLSLNHTLPIALHYSTHKACRSHVKSSQADLLYSSVRRVPIRSELTKAKVILQLSVSQSVNLGVEPHLGLMTRYLLLFDSYGLVFVGRPFWGEDGSVFCTCCWLLPAQNFSGPSPSGLETIFYCLRFETYLFIASYDSQGHGGGIRTHLHTGLWTYSSRLSLYSCGTDIDLQ
jgi:hypothetical protein